MAHSICKHPDGCPRLGIKSGWCTMHYQRVLAKGDPGPVHKLTTKGDPKDPICAVDGCPEPTRAAGLCETHYQRKRTRGTVGPAHKLRKHRAPELRGYTSSQLHRFYKYGLTPEAFAEILARQGGRCYICRTDTPNGKGWSVDHCHETNAVRFIACNPCNAALGLIKEDPAIAKRLYEVTLEVQQLRLI